MVVTHHEVLASRNGDVPNGSNTDCGPDRPLLIQGFAVAESGVATRRQMITGKSDDSLDQVGDGVAAVRFDIGWGMERDYVTTLIVPYSTSARTRIAPTLLIPQS